MRVYHVSTHIVEFPSVRIKHYTKDFSWGFYCTDNLRETRLWAEKRKKSPIINIYEYHEDPNLNILCFDKMTDEWLDFIAKCRRGFVHHYDIVKGPMLDDHIKEDAERFFEGKLKRAEFWETVQLKKPISQISFHTIHALKNLKYLDTEIVY